MRLVPPPRRVPWSLSFREKWGRAEALIGWLFIGFGGIFAQVFLPAADFTGPRYRGPLERAPAVVSACEKTHFSVGGSKHRRGTPVYGNRFAFSGVEGVSYATGVCLQPGARVEVEFPRGRPRLARITGQRAKPMSPWAAVVLLFPLIGAGLAAAGWASGRRTARFFAEGLYAEGRAVDVQPTNRRVNKQTVYKVTLAFRDKFGKERRFSAETTQPYKLSDRAEAVLYDPADPEKALALDLVGKLSADMNGELLGEPAWKTLLRLALPAAVLLLHGTWTLWAILRSR